MDHVADDVRQECWRHDVHIDPHVRLAFRDQPELACEGPVDLGPGQYGVDLIGGFSYIRANAYLRNVHLIGRFCAIAQNVVIGEFEHPTHFLSPHPLFQGKWPRRQVDDFVARNAAMIDRSKHVADALYAERFGRVVIGNDVWIGDGAFIRSGVEIGDGAIIGARAVVTRDVPPFAIVAGNPARLIRYRFAAKTIDELLRLQWWRYGLSALEGVDFSDVALALPGIARNVESGRATVYRSPVFSVGADRLTVYERTDDPSGDGP